MIYVSIDCETTGLKADVNQLLEVGVVIEDTEKDVLVRELPAFRALITSKDEYLISPFVMQMHIQTGLFGEIEAHKDETKYYERNDRGMVKVFCRVENLQDCLLDWLGKNDLPTGKLTAAGKNFYGFDYTFLKKVLPDIEFHHRCLDPVMYYLKKTDQIPPDLKLCCERAGLQMADYHTAVGDARMVIELIRRGNK